MKHPTAYLLTACCTLLFSSAAPIAAPPSSASPIAPPPQESQNSCALSCSNGSCNNTVRIDVQTEDECNAASAVLGCGSCKSAAASEVILSPIGISNGFVTLCDTVPSLVKPCPPQQGLSQGLPPASLLCSLPCSSGSCNNVWINVQTEDDCNTLSQIYLDDLKCGSCKSAAASQAILSPLGKSGMVNLCEQPYPLLCLGLGQKGDPCNRPDGADCAIPDGLTHGVCLGPNGDQPKCMAGQFHVIKNLYVSKSRPWISYRRFS